MLSPSEIKIVDLCRKALALQDSPEFEAFEAAVEELRVALHEHLAKVRDKVADYALLIASQTESQAAD